ncbi:MAG: UDP-2,3-diacylglucosamine hydrolase [Candidatus Celerinatantimonas neptuna]|nr:MAG: UDP-2,3-diacylglucosamine hydrolase [Candidatus Celerinatantimonas neptuna]
MVSYFIADLHLSDKRLDIVKAFVRFLQEQAIHADALYILGDLFDVWVGDDIKNQTSNIVATELKQLTDSGVCCYFIYGNRDFLLGSSFLKRCGMQRIQDQTIINLYGRKTMLLHGDILCTLDENYQKFRKTVHKKWLQWLFLHLPKSIRFHIAAKMRTKSQADNSQKADSIMDVTPDEVVKKFQQYQLDWMIHGHTHRPAIHSFPHSTQQRIVLGDWYEQRSILCVSECGIELQGDKL